MTGARSRLLRYGDHAAQVAELTLPTGSKRPPLAVTLHGGFWSAAFGRRHIAALVPDLVERGYAVLNVDYRGVGDRGGGWPGTFHDVAQAFGLAATSLGEAIDLEQIVTVGHSAGGHLALWLGALRRLPSSVGGSATALRPTHIVDLAGLADLELTDRLRVGGDAVARLLGGHARDVPDRYALASPARLLPLGVPTWIVHGAQDGIVPVEMSRAYQEAAQHAGDQVRLFEVEGADHFDLLDPHNPGWVRALDAIAQSRVGRG